MKTPPKTPKQLSLREQLAEVLKEREACSQSGMELILALEGLIDRFKRMGINSKTFTEQIAEDAVRREREVIKRARQGKK